jgi:nitric oxide reductase NorE protein
LARSERETRERPVELWSTVYDQEWEVPPAAPILPESDGAAHTPGEPGLWVFIFGDMLAFAVFFTVFLFERGHHSVEFDVSRRTLAVGLAVANTLLLLTSSWLVATAVRAVRERRRELAPRLFSVAAACGVAFVIDKGIEWGDKLHAGVSPATNEFFMFFFMLTGIHLVHVLIGLVVLAFAWRVTRSHEPRFEERRLVEACASYWHMVDLLWIVLFVLLYLIG